jgi:hypothetical protein
MFGPFDPDPECFADAAHGVTAKAAPMPNATAKPPTRPMNCVLFDGSRPDAAPRLMVAGRGPCTDIAVPTRNLDRCPKTTPVETLLRCFDNNSSICGFAVINVFDNKTDNATSGSWL